MAVRLIASDLDGTLFHDDHRPAPRTVEAVNAARAAGIYVVAITGRSYFHGADLAVSTGARLQWFIGSNGGHRLNLESRRLEERLVFAAELVESLAVGLPLVLDGIGFGWELADRLVFDERFVELSPISIQGTPRTATSIPPDQLGPVGKIFVVHPEVETIELVELVTPLVPPDVSVTTSGAVFVEITPQGADKGSALARLCEKLGVATEDVVAFGDNQNDLTMLDWAGRGIAMGNAVAMVQAAADEVAPPNTEFGVAKTIEAILAG